MNPLRKVAAISFLVAVTVLATAVYLWNASRLGEVSAVGSAQSKAYPTHPGSSSSATTGVEGTRQKEGGGVFWKPDTPLTDRLEASRSGEIDEDSFRVIRPLTEAEIGILLPDDVIDTQAAWSVEVDHKALEAVLRGASDRVALPTPGGWAGRVSKRVRRGSATTSILGRLEGVAGGDFLLVAHEGILFGHIADYASGVHYELRTAVDGDVLVRQLDQSVRTAVCGLSDQIELEESVLDGGMEHVHRSDGSCCGDAALVAGEVTTGTGARDTVDIVVGYSAAARSADGGTTQIEARIIASVDRMNRAFDNSGLASGSVELVLLATVEDPFYSDPGRESQSMSEELSNLGNSSDGVLDTVSDLAEHLGADLQAFIVRSVQGSAGIAYRPGRSSITARNYMSSDRITFVHELGHNFGLKHSWGDSSSDSISTLDNYGWRLQGSDGKKYRTIMAYDWGWKRIPYFANPDVDYQGVPTGAVNGYDASGDERTDSRYVSGGMTGNAGAGFDGTNPDLGARSAIYLDQRAKYTADNRTRTTAAPIILVHPEDFTVAAGESTSFSVIAGGQGPLSYQWRKNGIDLADSDTIVGAESESLSLLNARIEDSGNYTVVVQNPNGTAVSHTAELTVLDPLPPVINAHPEDSYRNEGERVTFSLSATGTPDPGYQWQKNGVDIPGAVTSSLTIDPVLPEDAGEYSCRVFNLAGSALSSPASLVVNARPIVRIDTPGVAAVGIPLGVGLQLNASASDDGRPSPGILINSWSSGEVPSGGVARFSDASSPESRVTFDGPGVYVLRFTADDGAIRATQELRVEVGTGVGVRPGSGVNLERFEGVLGNSLSGLLSSEAFVGGTPDHVEELTDFFEAPSGAGDNYGQRLRTFFIPPQSGDYVFWIASDDHSELYLSSDTDASNKTRIASVSGWTRARQWDKYASQESAPVALEAGQPYYMEVLHKEGSGGDHVAIGVTFPDASEERPLSTAHLALFDGAIFKSGPAITFGAPYAVSVGQELNLQATVATEGGLVPALRWEQADGPGTAGFSDPEIATPFVSFDLAGRYTLRLTASDGTVATFADLAVDVLEAPATVSLTVGSGAGGEVVPSGTLDMPAGSVVSVEARASAGFTFVYWTGDIETLADRHAANTSIRAERSREVTAHFEPNNPQVAPYDETWKARAFGPGADGPETGPLADYDGDGRANIIDYAFQIDAEGRTQAAKKLPKALLHSIDGQNVLAFEMRRIRGGWGDPSGSTYDIYGIRYHVEWRPDLSNGSWESDASLFEIVGDPVPNLDGTETVLIRRKQPLDSLGGQVRGFMRVRIEILP